MSNYKMLVGMPHGGLDWFARCLYRANIETAKWKYQPGYLNPMENWQRQRFMSRHFPCEVYGSMPLFGTVATEDAFAEVVKGMDADGCNFTREFWLGYTLENAVKHFDVFAMIPSEFRTCFPPHRPEVRQWYDMMFSGMLWNDKLPGVEGDWLEPRSHTLENRTAIAWHVYQQNYVVECANLDIPLVFYEELLHLNTTEDMARALRGFPNKEKLVGEVMISRETIPRPEDQDEQWETALIVGDHYKEMMNELRSTRPGLHS